MLDNVDDSYKRRIFFLVLLGLAVMTSIIDINTIEGVEINISKLFILLILFLYGFKSAIIISILINIVLFVYVGEGWYIFLSSIQITFLYILKQKNKGRNIVVIDLIFWAIIFLGVFFYIKVTGKAEEGSFIIVAFFEGTINSIAIMIIVDILISYIPYKFAGVINKNYYREIPFNIALVHIVLIVVAIPFILNLIISNKVIYNNIVRNNLKTAESISESIVENIESLPQNDKNKVLLSDTIQIGLINKQISNLIKETNLSITITNNSYKVLTCNREENNSKSEYNWRMYGKNVRLNEGYYQVVEDGVRKLPYRVRWARGALIYERKLENPNLNIIVTTPLGYNEELIVKDYIDQSRLMIFVIISIGLMVVFINKTMFTAIKKLSEITSNIPLNLNSIDNMPWPKSRIMEIKNLSDNFKVMGYKLKEMFFNITNLNNTLEKQAKELSKSQVILHQMAYYDKLTELPNRVSFHDYLGNMLKSKKVKSEKIGVMFMDLDHFKQINDTLGHEQGDKLLELVGKRLKEKIIGNIKIFRLGGDEFVIVVNNQSLDYIYHTAEEIFNIFKYPFNLKGADYKISASIGISVYPDHSENIDEIIKNADMAMYKSKEEGGGYPQMFNSEIKEVFINKIEVEKGIKEALNNGEFSIIYQPQIGVKSCKMESMEALIRWNKKDGSVVSPEHFITIAEESNLIIEIDNYVLREVSNQIKIWQEAGKSVVPIAVNISPKHFGEGNILKSVEVALKESNIKGNNLIIEITEGVAIDEYSKVINTLTELKKLGVKIAMDDFGKGYSSLTQLINLPITEVKLDREFIIDIWKDRKKQDVVELIINLSHKLNLIVVAEGIEAKEEYELLKALKCDLIQGHYFSKALNKEEILNFKLEMEI